MTSPDHEKVPGALLGGATVTAAAKVAQVDRASVHRCLSDDPAFIAAYNSYRIEMVEAVRSESRCMAAESVKTFRDIPADKDARRA